ncbi:MAG: DUF3105 domain-containing protein [Actinomycetota bacterium]
MSAEGGGFCPSCGTKRTAESQFCASCGFEFGEGAASETAKGADPGALDSLPPPPPPKGAGGIAGWGGRQWAIAGGGAAALLGGVLAIVLIVGGDEEVPLQPVTEPPVAAPALSPSPSPDVAAAAARANCFDFFPLSDASDLPVAHEEPYALGEAGTPAAGGNHAPTPLPPEPKVYTQQPPEEAGVHNLEHGYVIVYYRSGDDGLPQELVTALATLVNGETEVLMAPYEGAESLLWLVAWGVRQPCDPAPGTDPADVVLVARAFIDDWRNGPYAPEPAAA